MMAKCPKNKYQIYVGSIFPGASDADLAAIFGKHWKGRATPYGTFVFVNVGQEAERDFILAQNGTWLYEWPLRVEESWGRNPGSSSPRHSTTGRSSGFESADMASSAASDKMSEPSKGAASKSSESTPPNVSQSTYIPVGLNPVEPVAKAPKKPKSGKSKPKTATTVVPTEFQLCVRGHSEEASEQEVMLAFQSAGVRLVKHEKPFAFLTYQTVDRAANVLESYKGLEKLMNLRGQALQPDWTQSTKAYLDRKAAKDTEVQRLSEQGRSLP